MAITREHIFQAADQLSARGEKVTYVALQRALGGGSFSTIREYLPEWKTQQISRTLEPEEPMPSALQSHLAAFGNQVWTLALQSANARLSEERGAMETLRQELEAELREALEQSHDYDMRLTDATHRLREYAAQENDAKDHIREIQVRLSNAEGHVAQLEKELGTLRAEKEQALADTVQARARADELSGQVSDLKRQAAAHRTPTN